MTSMIESLRDEFAAELSTKEAQYQDARSELHAQTRALGEHRNLLTAEKARLAELDLVQARIRNLERALVEEQFNSWGIERTQGEEAELGVAGEGPADEDVPEEDSKEALLRLRRMRAWQARVEGLVGARVEKLRGTGAERELQYKRLVSIATKTPMEEVDIVSSECFNSHGSINMRCSRWQILSWHSRATVPSTLCASLGLCGRYVCALQWFALLLTHPGAAGQGGRALTMSATVASTVLTPALILYRTSTTIRARHVLYIPGSSVTTNC